MTILGIYEASVNYTGWRKSPNIALPRKLYPCDKEEPCEDIIFYSSLDEQEQGSVYKAKILHACYSDRLSFQIHATNHNN